MGKIKKVSAKEMEIAIADWYGTRVNVIVPNVTWGLFNHECDLVVMTGSGYVTEIEIKVDKYDLKNDVKKKHDHEDKKISKLFFAIPEYLKDCIKYIPERAGVMIVRPEKDIISCLVEQVRGSMDNKHKLNIHDQFQLARLGTMRIWNLKRKIIELNKKIEAIK